MPHNFSDVTLENEAERLGKLYPIILAEYNPKYPELYLEEREFLLGIFADSVLRISHIGSTAVPSLISKPTIDILLEIKKDTNLTAITERLINIGYIVNTPPMDINTYIKGYGETGFEGQVYHIHVREFADHDALYFRDYLIADSDTAKEYGELKQKLLPLFEHDRDGYTAAKGEFIGKITALARDEFKGKYKPNEIINHYDLLIDENNDPIRDVQILRDYMDKWDGQVFIDELHLDKNKTALEIGVGTGRLAIRTIPSCKHYTGIDISPKTVERANENLAEFENKTLICADFLEYKFTEKFDVIYSSLTFLHIGEKQKAIDKIAELLKNGGRFVLSLDKEHKGDKIDYGNRTLTIYPDTPQEIKQYITNAGLTVVSEKEIEFAWIIVAEKEH